mmetsp:Transcript_11964/g.21459  ORF Transcript_11964/g.21459 Transcript_11964/m.21459 type:complete len:283 (-) Transcript_11964:1214-2062(-)
MSLVGASTSVKLFNVKKKCLADTASKYCFTGNSARRVSKSNITARQYSFSVSSEASSTSVTPNSEPVHPEIGQILFSRSDIQKRVSELGATIGNDYQDKDLIVVGVLKGAFKFTSDLVTAIYPLPKSLEVDFMSASSYHKKKESSGQVKLSDSFQKLVNNARGKHLLIVEDVLDSGRTLSTIVKCFRDGKYPDDSKDANVASSSSASSPPVAEVGDKLPLGASSVKVVVLLDKRAKRVVPFEADYVGFDCPDEFIVGYGIDFAERYRYLPYVGVPNVDAFNS